MKTKNKLLIYILLTLSASNGCMVLANEVDIVDRRKQIKTEAQFDLLLAFIQKQTNFQARQTAIQGGMLVCGSVVMCLITMMMYDLQLMKTKMLKG